MMPNDLRLFFTRVFCKAIPALWLAVHGGFASSSTFVLPVDGSTLVGELTVVTPGPENTLLDLARYYGLGQQEMSLANPGVSLWVPGNDTPVVLPRLFILPPKPWRGIVINIPQRRLFYFPEPAAGELRKVVTLPISIGREGWSTPLGDTTVIGKYKDPAWVVPASIQAEHKANGEKNFPDYFPPGPDNPMGMLAIRIGFPGIFIHGTNKPWALGARVSHGCLHLYPEDAERLFPMVEKGVPVRVINEPTPVGYRDGHIYMQSFPVIEEYGVSASMEQHAIMSFSRHREQLSESDLDVAALDAGRLQRLANTHTSVPQPVTEGAVDTRAVISALPPKAHTAPPYGREANNAQVPDKPR